MFISCAGKILSHWIKREDRPGKFPGAAPSRVVTSPCLKVTEQFRLCFPLYHPGESSVRPARLDERKDSVQSNLLAYQDEARNFMLYG